MKKVLHILKTDGNGGAEKYIKDILINLKKDYEFYLVYDNSGDNVYELINKYNIKNKNIKMRKAYDLKAVKELANYVKKEKINVIHTHFFQENAIAVLAKRLYNLKCKIIRTYHIENNANKLKTIIHNKIINSSDVIIAVSKYTYEYLVKKGVKKDKIQIVYNGLNFHKIRNKKNKLDIRNDFNISEDEFLIGCVGRLSLEKGQSFLIDCINKIRDEKFKVLIIGNGEEKEKLNNKIEELKLQDKVYLTGFRKDILEVISSLDMLVAPSMHETLGYSVIEALACDIPVVATRVGGLPEIIDEDINGLLVEYNNITDMCDKIKYIINKKDVYNKYKLNARKSVVKKFKIDNMYENIKKNYK